MGQQNSKSHATLTFGYINNSNDIQVEYLDDQATVHTPDFVLDNPHLYQLELSCQHCSNNGHCYHKQNNRLSLVRKDLANDLNYIDTTYYPNITHYEDEDDDEDLEQELVGSSSRELTTPNSTAEEDSIIEEEEEQYAQEDETDKLKWSKLTIGEITPSLPKSQLSVDLSGKSLIKLSSSIAYLDNITKLDLSDNQMIYLPKAIGHLKNLRILNASKNQLTHIPETIIHLSKLKAMNLSHNKLVTLPKGIGSLPSLIILILNNNQLTSLPREISNLNDMITLNVSHNPLKSIPAEIGTLKSLKKLTTDECPFVPEFEYSLLHDPPSLFETCARSLIKSSTSLSNKLPQHINNYFKRQHTCSFCFGPYFDSHVKRGRFIERMGRQIIALDYSLCSAHWINEEDRVLAMFSTPHHKLQHHHIEDTVVTTPASTPAYPLNEPEDYFTSKRLLNSTEDLFPVIPESSTSRRPRSASTASNSQQLRIQAMQHQHSILNQELLGSDEDVVLPFVSLNSRQSQEADQILGVAAVAGPSNNGMPRRKSTKKANSSIKEGFASLKKMGRTRDRSETM